MQVSEVMHKGVVSVNINDSLKKVASLMRDEDIGSIPVFEEDRPVGFVTDRDIVISCVAEGRPTDSPVGQAMSKEVISVKADQDVEEAALIMKRHQISRVLVMDQNQRAVGMVSLHDLTNEDEDIASDTLGRVKQ